jgi:hypothetical protein
MEGDPMNARAAAAVHQLVVQAVGRANAVLPRRWAAASASIMQQQLVDELRARGLTELADNAAIVGRFLRKLENEN